MAAKRLHSSSESDPQKLPGEKRLKTTPSFSTVIREAMMVKTFQTLCASLEPLLRRVVKEEVEEGIARGARKLNRSPSLQLESSEPSSLQLIFIKKLSLPIFTGTKIQDIDNNPLQLLLIDTKNGGHTPVVLPSAIKVEIVALDGDFPGNDVEDYTSDQFDNKTVKAREGKRPLLAGDVQVTLRDGVVTIDELEFTDNSSWIRSRTFRVGARVVPGSYPPGMKIKGAMTEPFPVKDHRGELYKKNYPPSLQDEVWRLERIGKDGAFHKKLSAEGIQNVQQFLKMYHKDEAKLRRILGMGMSDRMWEGTMKHATTCVLGNKSYLYQKSPNWAILVNPVCQVICIWINGEVVPPHSLYGIQKSYVERMAIEAYEKWDTLEELDEINTPAVNPTTPLLRNDTLVFPGNGNHEVYSETPDFGCINIQSNNMHLDYSGWMFQTTDSSGNDGTNQNQRLSYYS